MYFNYLIIFCRSTVGKNPFFYIWSAHVTVGKNPCACALSQMERPRMRRKKSSEKSLGKNPRTKSSGACVLPQADRSEKIIGKNHRKKSSEKILGKNPRTRTHACCHRPTDRTKSFFPYMECSRMRFVGSVGQNHLPRAPRCASMCLARHTFLWLARHTRSDKIPFSQFRCFKPNLMVCWRKSH